VEDFIEMEYDRRAERTYEGYKMWVQDPYGFVRIEGLEGQFTSFAEAEKYIKGLVAFSKKIAKKASKIKVEE